MKNSEINAFGNTVSFERVTKEYCVKNGKPVIALKDISFNIEAGEFVTILGPSGCGKSTILRLIAGLERANDDLKSKIYVGDKLVTGPGPDRGLVFQDYSSFPWLTVKENILFGLKRFGLSRMDEASEIKKYLELMGLSDRANTYPSRLSGGQQQRVALARTLASKPDVLLMDEPFAALDAQTRDLLQTELLQIWGMLKPTILFVTHDIIEAALLGQRVIILSPVPAKIIDEIDTSTYEKWNRFPLNNGYLGKSIKSGEKGDFNSLVLRLRASLAQGNIVQA